MRRDKKDWKVGDRVQRSEWVNKKEVFHTGAVSAVEKAQREKYNYGNYYGRSAPKQMEEYVAKVTVKWDNGNEETLDPWSVEPEDNEYERAFRLSIPEARKRISEKLSLASKYLSEAVEISEETGVPFSTEISFLSQSYRPESLSDKFPELDKDFVREVSECYNEWDGWEHSAVC